MNKLLPILAIETSSDICSVCVYYNSQKYVENRLRIKNIHSEKIFEVMEDTLKYFNITLSEISTIAVSIGPGSFTGLRIGLAAVKGIAIGSKKQIIPVPTYDALALEIASYLDNGTKFAVANKADSDELYFAAFECLNGSKYKTLEEIQVIDNNTLGEKSKDYILYGNIGSNNVEAKNQNLTAPSALFIAKFAESVPDENIMENFDYLEPYYLKNFKDRRKNVK